MQLPKLFSKRGFTLIELLVVITIIIILAAVVMIAINPAEMARRGRDATRLSDIENVRKSIDLTIAEGGTIVDCPSVAGAACRDSTLATAAMCDGTGWVNTNICAYLAALPVDPSNAAPNIYEYSANAATQSYELNCVLESTTNADKMANDGGDNAGKLESGTYTGLTLIN